MKAATMRVDFWRQTIAVVALLLAGSAAAQPNAGPQTGDIIEALKPAPTRVSRNLVVRPKPEDPAAAAAAASATVSPVEATASATPPSPPPSLSLQIQFESNSARVRSESGPLLGNLVAALQSPELKANRFVIEGHTDASGNPSTNQRLSQQRAEEVRLYLVALGVHPARLRAMGKGASDPADPLNPLSAENRRVRVVTQP